MKAYAASKAFNHTFTIVTDEKKHSMNKQNVIVDLKPLGIIKIAGPDAEKFLQGQLTSDVREVTEQQSRLGAHCDHRGRIQATFRLFKFKAEYYLQIPHNLIDHLLTTLKKYAVFSKVTLTDVSSDWRQLGINGPDSMTIINEAFNHPAPEQIDAIINTDALIIRVPSNNFPRFCLLSSQISIESCAQHLQQYCQFTDYAYWQLLDIEAGIPSLSIETIGLFTPQQINYTSINGVSFNKGCYTGQEIVARMHYLGKSKQHMYKIIFSGPTIVAPGIPVLTKTEEQIQECGTLVQVCQIQENQWAGLAVIYDNAIGQKLYVENLDQPILSVQDLPYNIK